MQPVGHLLAPPIPISSHFPFPSAILLEPRIRERILRSSEPASPSHPPTPTVSTNILGPRNLWFLGFTGLWIFGFSRAPPHSPSPSHLPSRVSQIHSVTSVHPQDVIEQDRSTVPNTRRVFSRRVASSPLLFLARGQSRDGPRGHSYRRLRLCKRETMRETARFLQMPLGYQQHRD